MPPSRVWDSENILFYWGIFCTTHAQGVDSEMSSFFFILATDDRSLFLKDNLWFMS